METQRRHWNMRTKAGTLYQEQMMQERGILPGCLAVWHVALSRLNRLYKMIKNQIKTPEEDSLPDSALILL